MMGFAGRCVLGVMGLVVATAVAGPQGVASEPTEQKILEQLDELRQELKHLRGEMAQLRQAVTEIHRATINPPAPPEPPAARIDVDLGDGPVAGDPKATVGLVEFSDFQCPFCKRFHDQTFPTIKANYIDTGKLRYAPRDFPLGFHEQAEAAAVAAHCAGEQGAYWQMHEGLFSQQRQLGAELFLELVERFGLDPTRFEDCLKQSEPIRQVQADLAYAESIGVSGTPTFFVGRIEDGRLVDAVRIVGAQPYAAFEQAIREGLESARE